MISRLWIFGVAVVCLSGAPDSRPRIGVTLSGGGSSGLAHIGVLLWLEEHRVPVDVISGTSMGGLVGGFYATGMSAPELRDLANSLDWRNILRSGPPFAEMPAARKQFRIEHPGRLHLPMRGGIQLPPGLNAGDQLGLFLSRYMLPYTGDFDAFPIPFRCAATDLVSGRSVVLEDGPLAEALRATMAYPGVFTPVARNGMLLADGGLLDQLPVGAARAMGAEVVLAVNIADEPSGMSALASLTSVIDRALSIMIRENAQRSAREATVVVTPNTRGFGAASFYDSRRLIEAGYQAAEADREALSRYSAPEKEWKEYIAQRRGRIRGVPKSLAFAQVAGLPPEETSALKNRLERSIDPLSLPAIERDITRFVAEGFPSAQYNLLFRDNQTGLEAVFTERPKINGTLSLNTRVNASELQNVRLTTQVAFETAGPPSSPKWIFDFAGGFENRARIKLRYPLGLSGPTLVPAGGYDSRRTYIYSGNTRISEVRINRSGGGFDVELPSLRLFSVSAGIHTWYDFVGARPFVPGSPSVHGTGVAPRVSLTHNSQDDDLLPWRGVRVDATGEWLVEAPGSPQRYGRSFFDTSTYHPLSRRWNLFGAARGGTSFGRPMPFHEQFTLGGPLRLGAYLLDQIRGDRMAFVASGVLYRPRTSFSLFDMRPTLAAWYEGGGAAVVSGPFLFRNNGNAGVLTVTPFGLLFIGGSWDGAGERRIYFTIGRFF